MERAEWLEWRKKGIGASDAPIIMGVSPWSTPLKLYAEKIDPNPKEDKGSFITNRGNQIEPKIRALVEEQELTLFTPRLCVMEGAEHIRASLDGANTALTTLLEIKMSGKEDWERSKNTALSIRERIPAKYWPQLQQQLMVTGAKKLIYASYLYDKDAEQYDALELDRLVMIEVVSDIEYQKELLKALNDFWRCVLKKTPPAPSQKDYVTIKAKGLAAAVAEYKKLKVQEDALATKIQDAKTKIVDAAKAASRGEDGLRFDTGKGVRVRHQFRVGSVDYKKIPAVKGMSPEEFEQYRGKGAYTWTLEVVEEKEEANVESAGI